MGIRAVFRLGGELVSTIVDGTNVMFLDSNGVVTTIEGLKISKSGVIKEFPELENNEEWRKIAIERFKEKIKGFNNELEKTMYIKEELSKFGYEPKFFQRAGFRPEKFR